MAEPELELLRSYELRLLRCTLPSPPSDSIQTKPSQPSDHPLHVLISDVVSSIETGSYTQVLSSDAVRLIFKLDDHSSEFYDDSIDCADLVYSELMTSADSFLMNDSEEDIDGAYRAILVSAIAIAALHAFTQSNLTGPYEGFPSCPLPLKVSKGVEWDNWARNQLMSAGSDLLGKFFNLQYIVFSKMLLTRIKDLLFEGSVSSMDGMNSISWWLARLIHIQQRILDERSSSLFDLLQVYKGETLNHFGTSEKVTCYWGGKLHEEEALAIVSMLHLEAGIIEHTYGRIDSCRQHFESAEVASGLHLSITGVLGFRTVHQVEPKAQLVLVANTSTSNGGDTWQSVSTRLEMDASSIGEDKSRLHQHETCEASDILMTPRLVENDNDSGIRRQSIQNEDDTAAGPLKAIQQAIILARCLLIEKSTRHDEMQSKPPDHKL